MKILTVKYPWALAIVEGLKDIENRTWTPGGGPQRIAIHCGKGICKKGLEACGDLDSSVRGHIVGYVTIDEFVTEHTSPWFCGPIGWVLSHPTLSIEPFPVLGRLGLWGDISEPI